MDKVVRKMAIKAVSASVLALSTSVAFSGAMGPVATSAGRVYLGVFGGGGAVTGPDMRQHATAFFVEQAGGPLAVDGFGSAESSSTGMIGGHIGYSWNNMSSYLPLTPAIELEAYYMGGVKIQGHEISNDTVRLDEHDFRVSFSQKTGVFLINTVLNSDNPSFGRFKPYIGVGIGSAVISVSNASSIQVSPPEPGVNHFNAHTSDTAVAFAAQPKIGFNFDINPRASLFAEYRFLYLSSTDYTFGSTVYPGHAATSPWLVGIQSQYYNMGTVGINFDL
ncbi:hypothetical protein [Legionella sp. CNM-4043-24]|uniref:hypothetical protein n=1 Tax=Legionella sp. CNM-4043-24 TaxID=3421646 RepID=UPI00403AE7F1